MNQVRFNKVQYSKLKNLSYLVYIRDYDFHGDKAKNIMLDLLKQYNNPELSALITSTISFPFDKELYQFLSSKKMNDESILLASQKFGISDNTIKEKISEYIQYGFMDCIQEGLIDSNKISEIYHQNFVDSENLDKNAKIS